MGPVLNMVAKDLRRMRRAPLAMLITLCFPLILALLLGVTFGGGETPLPKVELLVEDRDDEIVSRFLVSALRSDQVAEYFEVETVGDEGRARLEAGDGSALLIIPQGFSQALLAQRPTALELVRNPEQQILPEVAEQLTRVLADVLSAAARVLGEPFAEIKDIFDGQRPSSPETVGELAAEVYRTLDRSEHLLFPPAITVEVVDLEDPEAAGGAPTSQMIFLLVLPGVAVFALFLIGDQAMRDLLTEAGAGTLKRQLSGPVSAGTVVAAKVVYTALIAGLCLLVLSAIAWWVTGEGVHLPAFAMLSLCLILLVTGASALIYGVAKDQNQGSTIATVIYLFLAFTGGSFIQTQSLPAALQALAPYTPFAWANKGFSTLLVGAGGAGEVLAEAGLLAGLGSLCLVVGSRLLERRLRLI